MNLDILKKLSNADAIAGEENEVRQVLLNEGKSTHTTVTTDGLGSLIFTKSSQKSHFSVMICGHMDEVGFMVRSISDIGMIYLMPIGGVKPLAEYFQKVRITTSSGKKISGIINGNYNEGFTEELYCDIGAQTSEEVARLGIEVGNMVTYATEFESFSIDNIYAGKAFDDRLANFVINELMHQLDNKELPYTLYFAHTSSEEVGIRGAKTAVQKMNPDLVFVIDVATFNQPFIRNHHNQRQIGKGPILTHFDRTLSPNRQLIHYIKSTAQKNNIPLQLDMFNSGGTDGSEAHKVNEGKPTVVTILPVRYGHCAYSLVHKQDVEQMIQLYTSLLTELDLSDYQKISNFI